MIIILFLILCFSPPLLSISTDIDLAQLSPTQGFRLYGEDGGSAGIQVSSTDINEDGINDIVIGSHSLDALGREDAGAAYVVYGRKGGLTDMYLQNINVTTGIKITGAEEDFSAGSSVSYAGDLNNDGFDDVFVGNSGFWLEGSESGYYCVYVLFGNDKEISNVDLADPRADELDPEIANYIQWRGTIDDQEFDFKLLQKPDEEDLNEDDEEIYVSIDVEQSGQDLSAVESDEEIANRVPVSGKFIHDKEKFYVESLGEGSYAGDVNGDGISDIIIATNFNGETHYGMGGAYVIFGTSGLPATICPVFNQSLGFKIFGDIEGVKRDFDVAGAGDINGDGLDDVLVSAESAGTVYVIFGRQGISSDIKLSQIDSTQGFKIFGAAPEERLESISAAGDQNGDGVGDIIVTASRADPLGRIDAGVAYVIYGRIGNYSDINLNEFNSSYGFKIIGATAKNQLGLGYFGNPISNAGDVNGDGIEDLIIGEPKRYAADGEGDFGKAYLIFGRKERRSDIDLAGPNNKEWIEIQGETPTDLFGFSVSGGKDVNGDGIADLIIGAPSYNNSNGIVYVIYGSRDDETWKL